MDQPNEYCEHLANCPQCQSFIDQLSDNPEMRRWAPARQSLVGSEPSEPVLERLLEELRSTPLPDNCRPEGVGDPAAASLGFLEPPRQAGDLGALGSYRVLAELARGGMGIVLLAYDANLQRKVALKVLPPFRADEQARSRFVREAQAAAGIDHDNVVPVYAVANPTDGPPYLVMQYVEGPTLREQIKKEGRLNPLGAAKMAAQVAEGLAAAHDAGLIHRDIKPGNIILDRAHGRAKIMDFGLVRLTYLPGTTQEGMLMGTPEYMSPEQVRDPEHLDARTDIYSLGVTLYEALTGEVPCRGVAHMVHQQILQDEPRPPRRLNDRIPRDLETICLQCLRKEPGQRYANARALADDLQRFLRNEPVRARPVSPWERGWRWARRNVPLATTGAVAVAALVAGVIVSVLFAVREFREHELAQRRLAESYMERAFTFGGQEQDYARGLLWLARALETAPEPAADLQQTIRASLSAWRREIFPLKAILPHPFAVLAAALSPDGRTVLTGGQDKTARLWDVVTAKALSPPLPHQDRIWAVAFSPDGRTILTGSYDRTAQRWHAATGEPIGEPLWHPAEVRAVTFSPDGRTILTGCFDGIARLWDAATGEPLGPPMPHPGGINAVTFSPDGRTIVTGGRDRMVRLWDATSGQAVGAPLPCDGEVRVVAFSPDGRTILTAGPEQPTRLWDVTTRSIVLSLPRQYIFSAAFSSDGKAVLTGGLDQRARLWDASTGQALGPPLRQHGWVHSVAFSPDGRTLLIGSGEAGARLWDATPLLAPGSLLRHEGGVLAVAFSPDGKTILTGSSDQKARLWDVATGKQLGEPLQHQDRVKAVTFSPDGKMILTGSSDQKAQLWDVATLKRIGSPLHHPPAWVSGVAFSPDGKMVVTGGFDAAARRWDVDTGKELDPPLRHVHDVRAVGFSPDGKTILTGSFDRTARLWDAATGKPLGPILRHPGWIHAVAFSPDGRIIVTGGTDQKAHRWHASSGEPLGPPLQHHGDVTAVAFSPDGRMILTGSTDQTARLWDAATGNPLGPPFQHRGPVHAVAFSPDGKRVLTGSQDETARLWEVPSPLPGTVKRSALWTQVLTGMELDDHGAVRMLDAEEWQQRRSQLEELGGPPIP